MRRQKRGRSFPRAVVRLACGSLLLFAVALGVAAWAAEPHEMAGEMAGHGAGTAASTSFAAMMQNAMMVMDGGMNGAPMTGDPDHDFAAMMIPHHQGAIDMAKAELLYGKNPVLRRLAQEIVVTQDSEITVMQRELQKQAGGGSH